MAYWTLGWQGTDLTSPATASRGMASCPRATCNLNETWGWRLLKILMWGGKKSSSGSHRSWKLSYKPALCLLFMKFFSSRFWWLRYVMCKQIGTSGPSSGTCFPSARSPFCLKKTTAGVFIHPFKIPKQKILMGKATTAKQTDFDRLQDFFFPFTS